MSRPREPSPSSTTGASARTTQTSRRTRAGSCSSRRRPRSSRCSSPNCGHYTVEALTKRGVEVQTGEVVESVSPARVEAEVGQGAEGAHARVGRRPAGERPRPVARPRARAREPDRSRRRPSDPVAPGGVRGRRHRGDHGPEDRSRCCLSSAPSRSSPASTRARRSRSWSQARRRSPSSTATRGRWRRSDAGRRSCRCSAGRR